MTKSMLFQILYSNLQTPNTQTFSECKILKAWVIYKINIHHRFMYCSLGPIYLRYSALGNTITNSYETLHNYFFKLFCFFVMWTLAYGHQFLGLHSPNLQAGVLAAMHSIDS